MSLREAIESLEQSMATHSSDHREHALIQAFKDIDARLTVLEKKPTTVLTSESLVAAK